LLNNDPQLKEDQKHVYEDLIGCFDEFNRILERIKVKYTNSFNEDAQHGYVSLTPLEKAVREIVQAVSALRSLPSDVSEDDRRVV